ncbi:Basal body-orientation factor 1 [Schistosoma japonicum]|nr:Basal body-orientation factor 1 [Schistosoma japonicum]
MTKRSNKKTSKKKNLKSRQQAKTLADDNVRLNDALRQCEKESMCVFSYLKKQNEDKDNELKELKNKIERMTVSHEKDKELIINETKQQITRVNRERDENCDKIKKLESEIMELSEYKLERMRIGNEIRELQDQIKNQKCLIEHMEAKFFEEKLKMRESSIKDIKALAEEAHKISIKNLDDSAKLTFVQNVTMRRFISFLRKQLVSAEDLSKSLNEENKTLTLEKEALESILSEKSLKCKKTEELIQEKNEKIEFYENKIEYLTEQLNKQKIVFNQQITIQTYEMSKIIEKLTRTLEIERKRMQRMYSLVNRILQQRNEIEEFFITSLNYVRDEIKLNQNNYIHDAKSAYEASIRLAHCGKSMYPPIRTFQNKLSSTNNVYDDFKIAQQIPKSTRLTIRDLTWEQKERVLSILFEKMNNSKMKFNQKPNKTNKTTLLPSITNNVDHESQSLYESQCNGKPQVVEFNENHYKSIRSTDRHDTNEDECNTSIEVGKDNDNYDLDDNDEMKSSRDLSRQLYHKLIKTLESEVDNKYSTTNQLDKQTTLKKSNESTQRNDSESVPQKIQTKAPYPSPQ